MLDQESEQLRQELLAEARECRSDIDTEFGPGSYGQMEAADRLFIQAENVYGYSLEHPAVLLDQEVYRMVYEAQELLYKAYQTLACREPPECKT